METKTTVEIPIMGTRQDAQPLVAHQASNALRNQQSATPSDLLRMAMDQGADLDRLERLMELQDRWMKREAEQAFIEAMTFFKLNAPRIVKNQTADFTTQKGRTVYDFSDLGNVVNAVLLGLAENGFSHSWVPDQSIAGKLSITCVLTHRMGHKESRTLSAAHDESGGKNSIQGLGSTATYLERYTLLMACGLAVEGADDDGASVGAAAGADLRTDMADAWIAMLQACTTDEQAISVWNSGSAALEKLPNSYKEFKEAVSVKRGALAKGDEA